jgi:TonB-dependent starch-binding outer membrane protein SusC
MKRIYLIFFVILGLLGNSLYGQERRVTGTVTQFSDGSSLPGVTVRVKGTTMGTITDMNGRYEVTVPGDAVLVFSYIGMNTEEIAVDNRALINVAMVADISTLEEIVVVGYGVQRKREVTGSISSVSGGDLAQVAMPSFDTQLAGRAAGVQVRTTTGVLGEAPSIRIRGISSISSGTYPLIVVDGIPILTGDLGGYASTNALGDINPSDIESIEILKDGSATAIYGSRASNGVILITTKRGKAGKFEVNYNNYFGLARPVNLFKLTNENEFLELAGEMFTNANLANPVVATGLNTDWQRAVLRSNAFQQDHSLSLSGANDITSYYFSVGYTDQEGVSKPNAMNRFTIRANVDQKVNRVIRMGVNSNFSRTEYDGMLTGENNLSGNVFAATRMLPNIPIFDPEHPTGYNLDAQNPNNVGRWKNTRGIDDNLPNIMYVLEHNKFGSKVNRGTLSAFGMVNILPTLFFRTQLGADASMTEGHLYYNPTHGDGFSSKGLVRNTQDNFTRWNFQNVLSYLETFADVHNFNVTLVQEMQKQRYNGFAAGGNELSDIFFRHNLIGGSYTTQISGGSMSENGIMSYAGRLNYNYDGKYFLQASARYDGLSSLPSANKWGFFPGASVGWTVSRESFMEGMDWLTDMKLRASYAEVGNSSIGNYPYLGLYSGVTYANYTGIAFSQMGNDQLKWETSKKTDIGLDMSILEGKYQFTYDYFENISDGLILQAPTPPSFGIPGNSVAKNIGNLKNWGHEFSLTANLVRTRDINWTVNANLTLSKNEVVSLVDDNPMIGDFTIIRVGESIRAVYGYEYVGVNKANGNPIYKKGDGSLIQGNITTQNYRVYNPENPGDISQTASLVAADDKKVFGPSMPTYFGGINSSLTYKSFDFTVMFRYSGGNYIMNRTREDMMANSFTNYSTEMLGRWQSPENPGDGWTPKMWHGRTNFINLNGHTNSRFVEKGDNIRLQNLILGYTLPRTLTNRIGVQKLRVFAAGTDLFLLTDYTGIDPEMERYQGVDWNGTPRQSTFTFGLNMSL